MHTRGTLTHAGKLYNFINTIKTRTRAHTCYVAVARALHTSVSPKQRRCELHNNKNVSVNAAARATSAATDLACGHIYRTGQNILCVYTTCDFLSTCACSDVFIFVFTVSCTALVPFACVCETKFKTQTWSHLRAHARATQARQRVVER
jgi:hypothetical protein